METSGEGKTAKLRRSPSLPVPDNTEESKREVEARTVYLKGFDKENTTLDELIDYFHNSYEKVLNVQMRTYMDKKNKERHFKGSVFVTFKDEGEPLLIKFQKDYFEEKSKEMADKKKERQSDKDEGEPLLIKFQKDYFEEKSKE